MRCRDLGLPALQGGGIAEVKCHRLFAQCQVHGRDPRRVGSLHSFTRKQNLGCPLALRRRKVFGKEEKGKAFACRTRLK